MADAIGPSIATTDDHSRWRSMQALMLCGLPVAQLRAIVGELSAVPTSWREDDSLRVAGEAVLDRSFSLLMNAFSGIPQPDELARQHAELEQARSFYERHGWLEDPRGYHRTPPPLRDWRRSRHVAWPGPWPLTYSHLRFDSEYASHPEEPGGERWLAFRENRTAHAYVLEHDDGRPRPWVVCVHGFGMGTPTVNFVGFQARRLHEELGLNVIFPSLPLHGPRAAGRMSGGDLLQPDYLNLVHSFAQAVWDIRRLLAWARARGAERIGLYGISLGGYNSALVSALDEELDCVVAGIPVADFSRVAQDNQPWILGARGLLRWLDDRLLIDWELIRDATRVVSPLAMEPTPPVERRFIFAGTGDRLVQPSQVRALWRHWGEPPIHWYPGGHVAGHRKESIFGFVADALQQSLR